MEILLIVYFLPKIKLFSEYMQEIVIICGIFHNNMLHYLCNAILIL